MNDTLIKNLGRLKLLPDTVYGHALVNPDGPAAVKRIRELEAENKALRGLLGKGEA